MEGELRVDVLDIVGAPACSLDVEGAEAEHKPDAVVASHAVVRRRGTTFKCTFKMFVAVMGAGSLVLAYAMASLGWVAGLLCMVLFASITFGCGQLLIACHENGSKRHRTYFSAVHNILGKRHAQAMVIFQQILLIMMSLSYAITAGTSLASIAQLIIQDSSSVWTNTSIYILLFSFLMLFVIQVNSLREMFIVCFMGTLCVAVYIVAVLYLGAFFGDCGSIGGAFSTPLSKMWSVFNALGLLFFTFSVSSVLMEIVDTIADKPVQRGHRAFSAAYAVVTVVLFSVAILTYGSVGDNAPNWFLDAFSAPKWVIIIANLAVVLSLIPAYNIYLLPFLLTVERPLERRFTRLPPRVLKLIWRSMLVTLMAIVGALLPFFTCFTALAGAIGFWPLTVHFPITMWIRLHKPKLVTKVFLHVVDWFSLAVTLLAIAGSVERIIANASSFQYAWSE